MAHRLTFWATIGFMLAAIGAVVAAANWPETTTDSTLGRGLGLMLLGVGSTMLSVVIIAVGVYCGLRLKDDREEMQETRRRLDETIAEKNRQHALQQIAAKRFVKQRTGP